MTDHIGGQVRSHNPVPTNSSDAEGGACIGITEVSIIALFTGHRDGIPTALGDTVLSATITAHEIPVVALFETDCPQFEVAPKNPITAGRKTALSGATVFIYPVAIIALFIGSVGVGILDETHVTVATCSHTAVDGAVVGLDCVAIIAFFVILIGRLEVATHKAIATGGEETIICAVVPVIIVAIIAGFKGGPIGAFAGIDKAITTLDGRRPVSSQQFLSIVRVTGRHQEP